ncbi:MAG: TlpA disulfide reductase family protein [Pseudomonadales bacterium]
MIRCIVLIAIAGLLAGCEGPDSSDTAGAGHRLEEFQGKWLFINYWATWCAPCVHEIPELNKLSEEHADELAVYGVNFDGPTGEERHRQIEKMNIEFPVFREDPYERFGYERPQVLPSTFVFSPEGEHVETLIGAQTEESLLAVMDEHE